MKFRDLDEEFRSYERESDVTIPEDAQLIVRLDGRGFSKLTREHPTWEKPFDPNFHDIMVACCKHLFGCGFPILYVFTQSDELSVFFQPGTLVFGGKARKYLSVLAGEVSSCFGVHSGKIISFDAKLCLVPSSEKVMDYFVWRQEDGRRNTINAHCYWLLRHQGSNERQATKQLLGLNQPKRSELLSANGIDVETLPRWQTHGSGLYWETFEKQGFDPVAQCTTTAVRQRVVVDESLSEGDAYRSWLRDLTQRRPAPTLPNQAASSPLSKAVHN
jgi:tRNA(His) guanylyltransferase